MKIVIAFIFVVFLSVGAGNIYAACDTMIEQDYIAAFKNSDYEVRNQGLIDLHECPTELAKPAIQQTVIDLVNLEIEVFAKWDRDDEAGKNPPSLGEDYGDYLIDLQKTLFDISDNPKTMGALLDSLTISGWNIDRRVIETYGEKLVPELIRQFNNRNIWNRKNYRILDMVARLDKTVKLSADSRKQLREIVFGGLCFSKSSYTQQIAIEAAAASRFNDDEIITKIESLSSDEALKEPAVKALAILRSNRQISGSTTTISASTGVINISLLKSTTTQ